MNASRPACIKEEALPILWPCEMAGYADADAVSNGDEHDSPVMPEDNETFRARTTVFMVADVIYVLLFFGLFTEMGYGATVFRFLSAHHAWAQTWLAAFGAIALLSYVTDVRMWDGPKAASGAFILGLAGLCLAVGMIFSFQTIPWLPLGFFLLFQPLFHFVLKEMMFKGVHIKHFMRSMMVTSICV